MDSGVLEKSSPIHLGHAKRHGHNSALTSVDVCVMTKKDLENRTEAYRRRKQAGKIGS